MAHHCYTQFEAFARMRQQSSMSLFVDLVAAFNKVIRQMAFSAQCDDEAVAKIFAAVKLPPEAYRRMRARLAEPPLLTAKGCPADLANMIAESQAGTWLSTEGLGDVVATLTGSRAGDPLRRLHFQHDHG